MRLRSSLLTGLCLVVGLLVLPIGLPAQSGSSVATDGTVTLAAVGDAIITRRVSQFDHSGDPGFHEMANIIRSADAAFVNLEINLFRLQEFKGWPEVENGGNWEVGPPEIALDLKAVGFDLFNQANNHTTDYGVEGMRVTSRLLDELELVHSGTGENLGYASRPGYLDTANGRVALMGMASTFQTMSRAGAPAPEVMGRPGLNPLRVSRRYEATPATLAAFRTALGEFSSRSVTEPERSVRVFGTTLYPGDENLVVETVSPIDRERILREIRNAADQADYVLVNSHSHEPGNASVTPPDWMVEFAHACIDEGATTFVIHGPHQLRGIEIYKGRPVFYSLGNFVFQNETIDPMPSDNYERYGLANTALASELYDARFRVDEKGNPTTGFPTSPVWYESVIAVPTFQREELVEMKLYPIDLGWQAPRSQRGTPRLADEETGRKIIERLTELSAAFGTRIEYQDRIGIWRR